MDSLQQLMQLIGYPYVGKNAKEAVKIGQEAQAKVLSKEKALEELARVKEEVKTQKAFLLEHQNFIKAIDGLIQSVAQMA